MLLLAFVPLLLLSLPPTASQRGPLSYGRSYGRYGQIGHRSSYGSYGHSHRTSKTARTNYPAWEPWANQYKKVDPVAEPEPEPRYKSHYRKASKVSPVLKKSAKIKFIKTTPAPTTTTTTTTTESLDSVFELNGNAVDKSKIRNQRLTIDFDEPSRSNSVTSPSVDSSTKGWTLIGFDAVPAVPMEYVRPDFMPVPAVPNENEQFDDIRK